MSFHATSRQMTWNYSVRGIIPAPPCPGSLRPSAPGAPNALDLTRRVFKPRDRGHAIVLGNSRLLTWRLCAELFVSDPHGLRERLGSGCVFSLDLGIVVKPTIDICLTHKALLEVLVAALAKTPADKVTLRRSGNAMLCYCRRCRCVSADALQKSLARFPPQ